MDADACPVRAEIVRLAGFRDVPVTMVFGPGQDFQAAARVELVRVDSDREAADLAIANLARPHDLVLTDDLGLACLALARGTKVLSFRGTVYDTHNIDAALAQRHSHARIRRGGGRHRGPRNYTAADRERFVRELDRMLSQVTEE